MTKILITVYLNTVFRILWKEVHEEQKRLDNGGRPFSNVIAAAMIFRSFLWPIVLVANIVDIIIKGIPNRKGA